MSTNRIVKSNVDFVFWPLIKSNNLLLPRQQTTAGGRVKLVSQETGELVSREYFQDIMVISPNRAICWLFLDIIIS